MDKEINDEDYHNRRDLMCEFIAAEKMESLTACKTSEGANPPPRAPLLRKEAFSGILSFLILTIYHLTVILEERYL